MRIQSFSLSRTHIPLKRPFVTAIRRALEIEGVCVMLHSDTGETGFGEATATPRITGETLPSMEEAIGRHLAPVVIGQPLDSVLRLSTRVQSALYGNTSAKAAVEMALFDLWAKQCKVPLYTFLGGPVHTQLCNDITISAGENMAAACGHALSQGFDILKIKSGTAPETDAQALIQLWRSLESPHPFRLRVDANQGWSVREAIKIIRTWEETGVPLDLVEQPVPAWDIEGLAQVQAHAATPIAADEAVFSPQDALRCIQQRAAQVINIKLMKTGGFLSALDICALCRVHGLECMVGCMLEGEIGAAAAAHLAVSQAVVTRVDIDSPLLCKTGFYTGGPRFSGNRIIMNESPGIGARLKISTS